MPVVKVVDSTFSHGPAIGYGGERAGERPQHFQWDTSPGPADVKVFTDIRLKEAVDDPTPRKIALLIEPPAINSGMYDWIVDNAHEFQAVLTHQKRLVERGRPFRFYPFGGSWIREWGIFPKTKMFSTLVSPKKLTEGHRVRHEVVGLPGVDSYGDGVGRWVESKTEALRNYRFAIIIENEMSDWWFTEKLIDAISQGCIPIYRGCPSIGDFFNLSGIIRWRDPEELEALVKSLTLFDYEIRVPAIHTNLKKARQYQCCEDWIVEHYGDLLWATS